MYQTLHDIRMGRTQNLLPQLTFVTDMNSHFRFLTVEGRPKRWQRIFLKFIVWLPYLLWLHWGVNFPTFQPLLENYVGLDTAAPFFIFLDRILWSHVCDSCSKSDAKAMLSGFLSTSSKTCSHTLKKKGYLNHVGPALNLVPPTCSLKYLFVLLLICA